MPSVLLLSIALATLVSEDLTCVSCGLLVAAGRLDLLTALLGCTVGIYVGDLGLWAVGRVAGAAVLARFSAGRMDAIRAWIDRRGGAVFFLARFVPGTRLPLYLLAGFLGGRFTTFAGWTLVAVLAWVPPVVLLASWLGNVPSWLPLVGVLGALAFAMRTRLARAKLIAATSRLWRWEFWPSWIFYLPLVPYLAWLSLRHRGWTVWTAANPGIEAGGVVGESKSAILTQLPADRVIPFLLMPDLSNRNEFARAEVKQRGWDFPLILKPDAGERGAGVRRVGSWSEVFAYLAEQPAPVIIQPYHAGPFEAGVFYYRLPGEERGHILAITDKVFPELVGDGVSTVEVLIWSHPRYRMQAATFLRRHEARRDDVLLRGEAMRLTVAGNHCQGTMFRDGARLWTPELEAAIDATAKAFDGFHIGRFDVRYADENEFRAGRDFAIVELNGVASEATSLYDPARSLFSAYRLLFRQWDLLFRIGAAWRERGVMPVSMVELIGLLWRNWRASAPSD